MPFLDGDIRASHTIRIFGTNDKKEIITDIWLDIERVDIIGIQTQIEGHWQAVYLRLYWLDDPEDWETEGGKGNPSRWTGLLKICSPDEEDQEDPVEWVPVFINRQLDWNEQRDGINLYARMGNRNDAENQVRLIAARRTSHYDTIVDKKIEAVSEQYPDWKQVVFASDMYDFVTDTKDKENHIEVQYMSCTMKISQRKEDENKDQHIQFSMKNSHYLNFTDEAKGPVNEKHGFNPPWALDPFQAIVNVSWGGLAVEFGNKDKDAPEPEKPK